MTDDDRQSSSITDTHFVLLVRTTKFHNNLDKIIPAKPKWNGYVPNWHRINNKVIHYSSVMLGMRDKIPECNKHVSIHSVDSNVH